MIAGVSVYEGQGEIDWPLVADSGMSFAIVKATEAVGWTDRRLAYNWRGVRAAGLVRGAYTFGRPSESSGQADAEYLLSQLPDFLLHDVLALDLEDPRVAANADLLAYCLDFKRTILRLAGCLPLIYSSASYLRAHNCLGSAELAECGLWLASWGKEKPLAPRGWDFWAIWQHSDDGQVPGIGRSMAELFNGTADQMRRYGKAA